LHEANLEVARAHFETDKESYYYTRPVLGSTNGKFVAGGSLAYNASTKRVDVTGLSPTATSNDIGKIITFFDGATSPARFFAGVITAFPVANTYEVTLYHPAPSLSAVANVTVGDWLVAGDVIMLTGDNQVLSPENMSLFDITNDYEISLVSYKEFQTRRTLTGFNASSARWAKYSKTSIELTAGSLAPALGTLRISAYWVPPKSGDFTSPIYCPDDRVSEVEDRLLNRLLSFKYKQPAQVMPVQQAELSTIQLKSKSDLEDIQKVR
jgi:hypothetical protein